MELKLNVYGENGEIVKTYLCPEFKILTGVAEDVLEVLDIDTLLDSGTIGAEDLGRRVMGAATKGYKKFRPFLLKSFPGMTEEEFKNTSIQEVGQCIMQIVLYTVTSLFNIAPQSDSKEKKRN